jgi:hypothetical protein
MFTRIYIWLCSRPRSNVLLTLAVTLVTFGVGHIHILSGNYLGNNLWCWPLRNRGTDMYKQPRG